MYICSCYNIGQFLLQNAIYCLWSFQNLIGFQKVLSRSTGRSASGKLGFHLPGSLMEKKVAAQKNFLIVGYETKKKGFVWLKESSLKVSKFLRPPLKSLDGTVLEKKSCFLSFIFLYISRKVIIGFLYLLHEHLIKEELPSFPSLPSCSNSTQFTKQQQLYLRIWHPKDWYPPTSSTKLVE